MTSALLGLANHGDTRQVSGDRDRAGGKQQHAPGGAGDHNEDAPGGEARDADRDPDGPLRPLALPDGDRFHPTCDRSCIKNAPGRTTRRRALRRALDPRSSKKSRRNGAFLGAGLRAVVQRASL